MILRERLNCRAPKSTRNEDEIEDHVDWRLARTRKSAVFAVADGASEGPFTARWAAALVKAACRPHQRRPSPFLVRWRNATWERARPIHFNRATGQFEATLPVSLPWYQELCLERGVAATFLVGRVDLCRHTLTVASVGDSLLAWWSPNGHVETFPFKHPDQFPRFPATVIYERGRALQHYPPLQPECYEYRIPVFLAVMTDALGLWFVQELVNGGHPHEELLACTADTFTAWVAEKRATGLLRDDDTTVLLLEVVPGG